MFMILAIAFLGWGSGMLVNYLADVLPLKRRLVAPFCQSCGEKVSEINYFIWPRRCPACDARRPVRTWIVELFFILAVIWLWYSPVTRLPFLVGLAWLIYFGVVTIIDLEHRLILHPVSACGAVLGLVTGTMLHGLLPTLLGGLVGFGTMLVLYFLGAGMARLLQRWQGGSAEGEALGFGDVNLSGVLGLLLGWPGILAALTLTIIIGGAAAFVYLILMRITGKYRPDLAIPYGPFLVAGAVILLFFKQLLFF